MADSIIFGSNFTSLPHFDTDAREHVIVQRPLRRILAFTCRTIDDVINDPVARNQVRGYYKLHRWIQRESEIGDLERQWNAVR